MSRQTMIGKFALGAAAILAAPVPAAAQGQGPERQVFVTLEAGETCPESSEDTIYVCAEAETDPRLPEAFRSNPDSWKNQAEINRALYYREAGRDGIGACSVGGGQSGFTGCLDDFIDESYKAKATPGATQASEQINAIRSARIDQIDEEARQTEAEIDLIREQQEAIRSGQKVGPEYDFTNSGTVDTDAVDTENTDMGSFDEDEAAVAAEGDLPDPNSAPRGGVNP